MRNSLSRLTVPLLLGLLTTLATGSRGRAAGVVGTQQATISVGRLAPQLSRRGQGFVIADPNVADIRVIWNFRQAVPLRTVLNRLAELTDSQVISQSKPPALQYLLRRRAPTVNLETEWRTGPRLEGLVKLRQKEDPRYSHTLFAPMGRGYLQRLSLGELRRIADGEEHRIPAGKPTAETQQRLRRGIFAHAAMLPGKTKAAEEIYRQQHQKLTNEGAALFFVDSNLMLRLGERSWTLRCPLGQVADEQRLLPPTRSNPYRQLEARRQKQGGSHLAVASSSPLPHSAQQPLTRDFVLPPDRRWRTALRSFAEMAGIDVVSDDYLTRAASFCIDVPAGSVIAPRGTPLLLALDQLCRCYGYLWWAKADTYYFRSRSWPSDAAYEPPSGVLARIDSTLRQGRSLSSAEFTGLSRLTARQWEALERFGPVRPRNAESVGPRRLMGCLGKFPAERWSALSGPGLLLKPGDDPWTLALLRIGSQPTVVSLAQEAQAAATPLGAAWRLRFVFRQRPLRDGPNPFSYELSVPALEAG